MIDFHSHILPGLDDGAKSMDDALEMARVLAAAGYRAVCCTTHHIRGAWHLPAAHVRQAVADLQAELNLAGIDLHLLSGREYYLDEFLLSELDDPLLLPGGLLLVELPARCDADRVRDTLFQLVRRRFTPMIAHPERSSLLAPKADNADRKGFWGSLFNSKFKVNDSESQDNSLLSYLRNLGCCFQGNLGSFAGGYGEQVRHNARHLLRAGIYTHLGSDAHSSARLAVTLSDGLREVERLTEKETMQRLTGCAYQYETC